MVYDLKSLRRHVARIEPRLSQAELGELLAPYRTNGRQGEAYTRAYVCDLERGAKPFTTDVLEAIGRFVTDRVHVATGGRVRVRARFRRQWEFTPVTYCKSCGREFVMQRSRDRICTRCRKHHRA